MPVVVAVSLVSGIVGLLLATKFYVLQEVFAGLLTVAVLLAVGVLLVVVFVSLGEVCQYSLHWAMNARSVKAGRHNRRDSRGAAHRHHNPESALDTCVFPASNRFLVLDMFRNFLACPIMQ
jgi:hypothetical protein